MPKVNITDKNGLVIKKGSGLYRNGSKITATGGELSQIYLNAEIADISGTNAAHVVCPSGGILIAAYGVLINGTPGGDTDLAVTVNGGSTVATLELASGDAAGTVASSTDLTTSISAGQDITIASDGGASSARTVKVTFVVQRTS